MQDADPMAPLLLTTCHRFDGGLRYGKPCDDDSCCSVRLACTVPMAFVRTILLPVTPKAPRLNECIQSTMVSSISQFSSYSSRPLTTETRRTHSQYHEPAFRLVGSFSASQIPPPPPKVHPIGQSDSISDFSLRLVPEVSPPLVADPHLTSPLCVPSA